MAKIRVNRSDLGPMCVIGMLFGAGMVIAGIVGLVSDSVYMEDPWMTIFSGALLLVASIIARIVNAPYIDGKASGHSSYTGYTGYSARRTTPTAPRQTWTCSACRRQNLGTVRTCQGCGVTKEWSDQKAKKKG